MSHATNFRMADRRMSTYVDAEPSVSWTQGQTTLWDNAYYATTQHWNDEVSAALRMHSFAERVVIRTPDIASNTRTSASLALNGTLSSSVDYSGDADWIKVALKAGQQYTITLSGQDTSSGSLSDPYILGIYNSSGRLQPGSRDDDSGPGLDSELTFSAAQSGNYFISAGAYGGTKGSYQLSLSVFAPDIVAPTLVSHSPGDNATGVSSSADVILNFSENVRAGGGYVTLTGGGQTLQILVTDTSQVSFNGKTMTINPQSNLAAETQYEVSLSTGAVLDSAGNAFVASGAVAQFITEPLPSVVSGASKAWTIMVYIASDNNLEQFALLDLNEMESVYNTGDFQTTVLMDRTPGYDDTAGNWTDARMGLVTPDGSNSALSSLRANTSIGEVNTGRAQTLTDFINWSVANHAADNYALVIWNHGGGLGGAAWDDSSGGDNLTLSEMSSALRNSNLDHLDVLAFDACLMGMVEVATQFEGLADYMVASEELIPGDGFAYDDMLNSLANVNGATALDVVGAMLDTYESEYAGQTDITLSAVDLNKLSSLTTALNQFTTVVMPQLNNRINLNAVRVSARDSVDMPSDGSFDYVDLHDFMSRLAHSGASSTIRTAASGVVTALEQVVVDEIGTVGDAGGLSIYLPFGNDLVDSSYQADQYAFLAGVPRWDDFLAVI